MEIEIRAKINSLKFIERKLEKCGAILKKETKQEDVYFGEKCLYDKIGYSFMLRVRDEEGKIFLTYKGAKTKKDGVWEEYEFQIRNKKMAIQMLKAMGLEKIIEVRKTRKEYKLSGLSVCLDSVRSLGNFVEIEIVGNNKNVKTKLYDIMKKLEIKKVDIIHKGYITMLLRKLNSPYAKHIKN